MLTNNNNMQKKNICENLLRRSVENQFLTHRHNKREEEMLKEKFAFYQRQIRLIDHNIHMAEYRFEQHARNDLGLTISYRRKPLEASNNQPFYYTSTNKNSTTKIYTVESVHNVAQYKNLYEFAFERRSRQYTEELKEKNRLHKLRKQQFMETTESFIRDDDERANDWFISNHNQIRLPAIHHSKSKRLPKVHFPVEI